MKREEVGVIFNLQPLERLEVWIFEIFKLFHVPSKSPRNPIQKNLMCMFCVMSSNPGCRGLRLGDWEGMGIRLRMLTLRWDCLLVCFLLGWICFFNDDLDPWLWVFFEDGVSYGWTLLL